VNLTFSYPRWIIDPREFILFVFPATLVALIAAAWLLRSQIGRGPLAAILIFVGVLTPALGFFNTYPMRYSFVADHFQYTAGIAMIVLASAATARLFPQRLLIPIIGIPLAILTWRQSHIYASEDSLWRDVIRKNPASWLALENLGVELTYKPHPTRAQLEEAVQLFQRVQQIRPQHEKLHANWAQALFELGQWGESIPHFEAARKSPGASQQLIDQRIGIALSHLNRWPEAEHSFRDALQLDPSDTTSRRGLADALAAQGKPGEALFSHEKIDGAGHR
jgi:tetratricopeptide (TPR) repeat protein